MEKTRLFSLLVVKMEGGGGGEHREEMKKRVFPVLSQQGEEESGQHWRWTLMENH